MKKKVRDLLKSGNFTIAYHDNGYCCLYEGKLDYDDLPENGEIMEWDSSEDVGYIPSVVGDLVEILRGKTGRIEIKTLEAL